LEEAYKPKFLKDLARVPKPIRAKIESFVFENLNHISYVAEAGNIEKLKGYPGYYKVHRPKFAAG